MDNKMKHTTVNFEIKSINDDDEYFIFKGYASTFGNKDFGGDIVERGAFIKSIDAHNSGLQKVKVLWQHDRTEPIGMPTLMKEDDFGLYVEVMLPKADSFVSGRVIPQIKVGSIDSMSIGYYIGDKEYKDGAVHLKVLDLVEFSLVTKPMNPKAIITEFKTIDSKGIDGMTARQLEEKLIEGTPFSDIAAKRLISIIKDGLRREVEIQQRDAELKNKLDDVVAYEIKRKLDKIKQWRK